MLLLLLSDFREHREPASEMSIAKRLCAWLLCSFSPRNSDLGWSRMEVRGATEQKSLKWRQFMKTWYDIVQHDNTIYVYTYIIIYIYNILYMISELNRIDMNRRWCWRNFTLFGSKRSSARKRSILTAWNPGFQRAGLCNRRGAPSQQDPTRECYFRVIVPHIKNIKKQLETITMITMANSPVTACSDVSCASFKFSTFSARVSIIHCCHARRITSQSWTG